MPEDKPEDSNFVFRFPMVCVGVSGEQVPLKGEGKGEGEGKEKCKKIQVTHGSTRRSDASGVM